MRMPQYPFICSFNIFLPIISQSFPLTTPEPKVYTSLMLCPYCQQTLRPITIETKSDQQAEIHECLNCGGHWFPRWLANDVNLSTAKNVDAVIPQTTVEAPDQPRCPVCQNRLTLIQHDSVAHGIMVWACPQGHGNYFPLHELLRFKTAQEAKITYHQVWGIPIKSIFAVLLPVIAVITIAAGTPILLKNLQTSQESRTQASAIVKNPLATQLSENSVIISFTSTQPIFSEINLYQNDQLLSTQIVSPTVKTTHSITLTNLLPATSYTFTIKYSTPTGVINTTPHYPLILQ